MITPQEYKNLVKPKKHKYNAKQTIIDGIKFPSKKEAEYYKILKDKQKKGEISHFHRQILFDLPGGIKHYVDFEIIIPYDLQGNLFYIEYVEVKGRDNPIGKLKRKQCEDIYGIEIKLV